SPPHLPGVRRRFEPDPQVTLVLRRMRTTRRATWAQAQRRTRHELLAVEYEEVGRVEARHSAHTLRAQDGAEAHEAPADAGEAATPFRRVGKCEPGLESAEGGDLERNDLGEAALDDFVRLLLSLCRAVERDRKCSERDEAAGIPTKPHLEPRSRRLCSL